MRYQEVKLREARRLGLIALIAGVGFILSLSFRNEVAALAEAVPSRRGGNYEWLLILLGLFAAIFAAAALGNLLTSPAQDARLLKWAADHGKPVRRKFDQSLLEPDHADWELTTLRYLLRRR